MIKNIPAHRLFFFTLLFMQGHASDYPTITVTDLFSPETFEQLLVFNKTHSQHGYGIRVLPSPSLFVACKASLYKKYSSIASNFSAAGAGKAVAAVILSLGWVSYLLCAYVIYKAFKLLRTINSWVNWCIGDDLDAARTKDFHKKLQKRLSQTRGPGQEKKSLQALYEEERIVRCYLSIDTFLRARNLRTYFPFWQEKYRKKMNKAHANMMQVQSLACTYHSVPV